MTTTKIRFATPEDLDMICAIENSCFPPNEAASRESLEKRLSVFPGHFWVLESDGRLVAFANGMVTDNDTILEPMFGNASLHDPKASWQCIFGLAVAPAYRKHGYAGLLMRHVIEASRRQGRKGVTLTCKLHLIPYYEKLGFYNAGLSRSTHGGETWYDMKIETI